MVSGHVWIPHMHKKKNPTMALHVYDGSAFTAVEYQDGVFRDAFKGAAAAATSKLVLS